MNWLDVVFAITFGVSVFSGFRKGMVRIGIGFAATLLGFLLAAWFYGTAGSLIVDLVGSRTVANFLGFLMVFTGVIAGGAFVSFLIAKALKIAGLSWADRAFGGLFGVVRGVVVCVVLLLVLMAFPLSRARQSVADSVIAPYVIEASNVLAAATPNEIRQGVQSSYEVIQKIWSDTLKEHRRKKPLATERS
jgi:membrane protein required for colicin V production